jgi:DNA-binding LytR/AlgR family response regulator
MIFNRPFPANTSVAVTMRYSSFAGLIVFLILYLFRPFGIDAPGNHFTVLHALAYGGATFVMLVVNSALLPMLFKDAFQEEGWTLGKEILVMCWHIMTIALVNVLVTNMLYGSPVNARRVIVFLLITGAVGIFPVTFILLIKQQFLYRKFHRDAHAIQDQLAATQPVEKLQEQEPILLKGDNAGEVFKLTADALQYITSADNYLRVVYLREGKPETIVLRSTLKKAELMLAAHPNFLRCHRAYIVNLSSVEHLSGNAQGLKLHLAMIEERIPVSRSQNESISEELQKFSHLSH